MRSAAREHPAQKTASAIYDAGREEPDEAARAPTIPRKTLSGDRSGEPRSIRLGRSQA